VTLSLPHGQHQSPRICIRSRGASDSSLWRRHRAAANSKYREVALPNVFDDLPLPMVAQLIDDEEERLHAPSPTPPAPFSTRGCWGCIVLIAIPIVITGTAAAISVLHPSNSRPTTAVSSPSSVATPAPPAPTPGTATGSLRWLSTKAATSTQPSHSGRGEDVGGDRQRTASAVVAEHVDRHVAGDDALPGGLGGGGLGPGHGRSSAGWMRRPGVWTGPLARRLQRPGGRDAGRLQRAGEAASPPATRRGPGRARAGAGCAPPRPRPRGRARSRRGGGPGRRAR
jgi:hypothetical protein